MDIDRLYKAGVSELWRDLEKIDNLIAKNIENNYSESFVRYMRDSLIVFEFIKSKKIPEKREFLRKLEDIRDYYNHNGNSEMGSEYSIKVNFFKREFAP
ncbi:hypothetical protein J4433_01400 [Candidatus Pacearchaeota archaeon]|nr:hypothetical protein [Candidatus Pacearchaeota archaeon]